jgi:hypothetical protein
MDIKELKAQAYDALRQIEIWQMKLRQINEEILKAESRPGENGSKKA